MKSLRALLPIFILALAPCSAFAAGEKPTPGSNKPYPEPEGPREGGPETDPAKPPELEGGWNFPEGEGPSASPEQDDAGLPASPRPQDGPRFRRVARGYLSRDNPRQAEQVLDRYLDSVPDDAEALATRAQARLIQGDFPEAISDARKAAALAPDNAFVRDVAVFARTYEHRAHVAVPKIGKQLEAQRDDLEAPRRGEEGAAMAGAAITPRVMGGAPQLAPRGLLEEANSKLVIDDFRGAYDILNRAIDRDGNDPRLYVMRAGVLNRLRNHKAALIDADAALEREPANAAALRERAYANLQLGNYQLALTDATKAIELEPRNALGYVYRALAYEKLSDFAAALADLKRAAALDARMQIYLDDFLARSRQDKTPSGSGFFTGWRLTAAALGTLFLLLGLPGFIRRAAGVTTGSRSVTPGVLGEGSVVGGNYRIIKELGRGGMGTVYEAMDLALDRRVALKRMTVEDPSPEFSARFMKEAKLVALLAHPNLVQIFAVVENAGEPYLVFEFVDGRSLDQLLAERGNLSPDECVGILRDLCAGLGYAHRERIIHRDIKPSNVMVTASGKCKVMDFGIAHKARTASIQTRTVAWGTPPYMAPEQEMGSVSVQSDLYSLAVLAYELLTGRRPFAGGLDEKLNRRFAPATEAKPGLPAAVNVFLDKALDPDPQRRFRTAAEFLSAAESALRAAATPHPGR